MSVSSSRHLVSRQRYKRSIENTMTTPSSLDTKNITIQNFSFSPLSRKHSSSYQTSLLSNFYKTHEVDVAKTWFELSSSSKKPDEYENFVRISKSFTEFLTQSSSTKLPALLLQYLNLRQSQGSTRESVFSDLKLFQKAVETIASKSNFELPEDRT